MKVVVAIDSFKGSLSSPDVGNAAKRGILRAMPEAQVQVYPLADGGEGTVHALIDGMGGQLCTAEVTGPLGDPVESTYGILKDNTTAVMEMASAAGITLVPPAQRNPMDTTTFGVGEMIRDAIARGCRKFIVGIGGSATNDGGAGMLMALGYELLDAAGRPIPRGARGAAPFTGRKKGQMRIRQPGWIRHWPIMPRWLCNIFRGQTRIIPVPVPPEALDSPF